jgi:hypothetical protein
MRMYVVKEHYGIPHEHARTLCIGGYMKVLEGSTIALCVDVDVRVFEADVLSDCRFGLDGGVNPTVQWCQQ